MIQTLFHCSAPGTPFADCLPTETEPGIFGHISGYCGVVEPQLRKALHFHCMIQLFGFSHPRDLFRDGAFVERFRRMWYYVASIVFRSTEGYAAYTHEHAAFEALQQEPLLPITPKQRGMIGKERADQSIHAQLAARGLREVPEPSGPPAKPKYYVPKFYGNGSVDSSDWAAMSTHELCASTRKAGNHICRPDVCHKGRVGRCGFCRLGYWHWVHGLSTKGEVTALRSHGNPLQERWNGEGIPPVRVVPPFRGSAVVETTHPFHIKMNPGIFLGPRCNHDVGVLLRFMVRKLPETAARVSPQLLSHLSGVQASVPISMPAAADGNLRVPSRPRENKDVQPDSDVLEADIEAMIDGLLEELANSEFYCSTYATKEQPHVEGLLQTLAQGVSGLEEELAQKAHSGEHADSKERARRVLNRLLSTTNRRMHKGFPEMLSYLLQKPMWYCSHSFSNLHFQTVLEKCFARVRDSLHSGHVGSVALCGDSAINASSTMSRTLRKVPSSCTVEDYIFRSDSLESFPWYFFTAAVALRRDANEAHLRWKEYTDSAGRVQRHSCYLRGRLAESKQNAWRGLPLRLAGESEPLRHYPYFLHLRTQSSWHVPLLFGRMPPMPDNASSSEEKGKSALFFMLLFRSWRGTDMVDFVAAFDGAYGAEATESEKWDTIYHQYVHWRRVEIEQVAAKYLPQLGTTQPLAKPAFNSRDWWACMVWLRLRNLELVLAKHSRDIADAPPSVDLLPPARGGIDPYLSTFTEQEKALQEELDANGTWRPAGDDCVECRDDDFPVGSASREDARSKFSVMPSRRCLELPGSSVLTDFVHINVTSSKRGAEIRYAREYVETLQSALPPEVLQTVSLADQDTLLTPATSAEMADAEEKQRSFFQQVDAYHVDAEESSEATPTIGTSANTQCEAPLRDGTDEQSSKTPTICTSAKTEWETRLRGAVSRLPAIVPSPTVVMQAAVYLIEDGLFNIPDTGTVNVKQAHAFLHIASWLQERMTLQWVEDGQLPRGVYPRGKGPTAADFVLVLIGPGGTGKTSVLKAAEALIDHFHGPESVRKCALSNTASRLLGGDTLHALCKLPREDLQQKQSKLTGPVLKKHRARWKTAAALFIDEISMVAPDQFHQCNIRVQQATQGYLRNFGGLGTVVCGDFLQLPPIERSSLAPKPIKAGHDNGDGEEDAASSGNEAEADKPSGETSQGLLLWRSFHRVVSLTVNMRAPGILGRLQAEMRAGSISPEMWDVYQSRILQPKDARLLQPPFSTTHPQYIVHRHRIRVRQSFQNAVDHCRSEKKRLYIVKAAVEARVGEEHYLTAKLVSELLGLTGQRCTNCIQSVLPLYIGMRLLLYSKDCVRFGLMKGS